MRQTIQYIQSIIFVITLVVLAPGPGIAQDSTLISFKLEDQFERPYTDQDFRNRILVVIGADKDGSQYAGLWGEAINETLSQQPNDKQITLIGLSDLRGVPFFLKGYVRGKFPKEDAGWMLMDWKGRFADAYQFEQECSNILIFDQQSRLIYQASVTAMDEEHLAEIVTLLHRCINSNT